MRWPVRRAGRSVALVGVGHAYGRWLTSWSIGSAKSTPNRRTACAWRWPSPAEARSGISTQETEPLTATEVAEFERATAIRMARQAHAEAEQTRREQAERDAREAEREAAELARRSMGIRSRTGEEIRADLARAQAEDDQYEAARATMAQIDRRRAARRRALETEARADALAQVAGQSAHADH